MKLGLTTLWFACLGATLASGDESAQVDALIERGLAAEADLYSEAALGYFLQANAIAPDRPFVLQKIARQYSDAIVDLDDPAEQQRYARLALDYAEHAAELDPTDAVNILSMAVARGKLATYSDTRTKIELSRQIKTDAEQALTLDPDYAWAHHVLGRWHREVYALGTFKRWIVRLVYGGLPNASLDQALVHLEQAVALEPEDPNHHLELGLIHLASGRTDAAEQAIECGLTLPSRAKHDELAKVRARDALIEAGLTNS